MQIRKSDGRIHPNVFGLKIVHDTEPVKEFLKKDPFISLGEKGQCHKILSVKDYRIKGGGDRFFQIVSNTVSEKKVHGKRTSLVKASF